MTLAGLLPMHALVACSLKSTFEWYAASFDVDVQIRTAHVEESKHQRAIRSRHNYPNICRMTPLQATPKPLPKPDCLHLRKSCT